MTRAERDRSALRQQIREVLTELPASAFDELAEDTRGKLVGTVEPLPGPLLVAPLSGRPCVYFAIAIDERVADMRRLVDDEHAIPFSLVHGGHRAVIEPAGASISIDFDRVEQTKGGPLSPAQVSLVGHYRLGRVDWWYSVRHFTFREAIIAPGARVAVCGAGVRDVDPAGLPGATYRTAGAIRFTLAARPRIPLYVSDDPAVLG